MGAAQCEKKEALRHIVEAAEVITRSVEEIGFVMQRGKVTDIGSIPGSI